MNIEDINLGEPPTGAGGDTMRTAFGKTNQNFGAAKQALEDEVQAREQLLSTQRDQLIALIESVNGPLPALRADFKARSFGFKDEAGLFLPCGFGDVFSLSAPSPRWVWDSLRQLVEVPAGQPAFDHDPVTGEPLGQRLRPEATNHFPHWAIEWGGHDGTATRALVAAENPFGLNQVTQVSQSGSGSIFYIYVTGVPNQEDGVNTFTFTVKPGPGIKEIGCETSPVQPFYFRYNVDTGEVGKRAENSVDVTLLRDGFIQFSVCNPNVPNLTRLLSCVCEPRDGSAGAADSYFLTTAWNYNHASSFQGHIITDGSAVTRAADVVTIQSVDRAEWFNADAFTLYAEVTPDDVQNLSPAVVLGATAQDRVILFFQNGEAVAQVRGNQGITSISPAPEINTGDKCRFAVSYRPGTAHISFNGVTQTVVNELDATPTRVAFGSLLNGTFRSSLTLSDFTITKRALSVAELQELTS